MNRSLSFSLLALACLALAPAAHAQTLVTYQFTNDSLAPTTVASTVTASNVNFTGSVAQDDNDGDYLGIYPSGHGATNAASAVSQNIYF